MIVVDECGLLRYYLIGVRRFGPNIDVNWKILFCEINGIICFNGKCGLSLINVDFVNNL